MERQFNYDIMKVIKERWSPREFSNEKVPIEDLKAMFEAARYAPSCFNEQPWKYIVAYENDDVEILRDLLMEGNSWAKKAPVLVIAISKNIFKRNNKKNNYNKFDTGTSWGFLSLEAKRRGYDTHGMAGFSKKKARDILNIPEDYDIIAMIAIGKIIKSGNEKPNTRKSLEEVMIDINFFKERNENT